ncbi:MAG TPA: class I SAM-dependent rRNA methyltransferase [Bryobacteraceae bacterium]|nr:class I SAM-dependent rRNA methyltransferase [Bryobacteraceae bacterium]
MSRKGADRIASGHPWVFSSDVQDRGGASPGDVVTVADPRGRPLGTAHYSDTSQISLRLLTERFEPVDRSFFAGRLKAASEFRQRVVHDTSAYRLVHGEADGLPGLVVDRYGDFLVIQTLDQGMDRSLPDIVACLEDLCAPSGIVARNDAAVRVRESLPRESTVLTGNVPDRVSVRLNGLTFLVDILRGQKTGFFLDQRENYSATARYARGHALDCFTFEGGFALHLAGGCESVEAVDSSEHALCLARENAGLNGIGNVQFRQADVFDLLAGYSAAGRRFDTVVLDPPGFAKSRSAIEGAARGYKDLNLRALRLLGAGGVLVTCSCSHHVSEAMLLEIVASASLDADRKLRVLERRTQALDHPILLTIPETHYLKCVILEVA